MLLPELPYMTGKKRIKHSQVLTMEFKGLNLTNSARDGEFVDTIGLQTAEYPYLTQIPERTKQTVTGNSPDEVFVWDRDIYLYIYAGFGNENVDTGIVKVLTKNGTPIQPLLDVAHFSDGRKQMAVINTKLVIFPDKKYVDLTNNTIHDLASSAEYTTAQIVDDTISVTGIDTVFHAGETVDITQGTTVVRAAVAETETDTLKFADGALDSLDPAVGTLSIVTAIPDLDFICSSNNRIWGCNIAENTIYASALGDPTDFFSYSSDIGAYAVAVGSEGDFTGICNYGGAVLAWKENMLHKVLGQYPSEYYIVDSPVYGVQKGSERSMVVINNVLYYKGVYGVYQYAGNQPVSLSYNLGNGIFTGAVGGTDGRKYYIDMADPDGNYHLYAYDLAHGLWMKEEDGQISSMANLDRDVYYVKGSLNTSLYKIGDEVDPALQWYGELAEVTENLFFRKGYLKLLMRLDMSAGSKIVVSAKEDRKPYRKIWQQAATNKTTLLIPIRLGRCDRWQLKISGVGQVTVRGIGREFVTGSEK